MKKIAVVSCYFQKNYGSALQALATQKILDELGVENVTLNYSGIEKQIKKKKYFFYMKKMLSPQVVIGKMGYIKVRLRKKLSKSQLAKNLRLRDASIKKFEKHFRLSKTFSDFQEISDYVSDFDAVLVGSDQLWLPSNLDADYYTLNWVPDKVKRISYATSFGVPEIPKKYYPMAKHFLERIDHLSVREQTGAKIVKDICGLDAKVICDPTMMLTSQQWMDIQQKEPLYKKNKYIFCYFLGDNPEQREFVKKLKELTGYDIVSILHLNVYVKSDEHYADYTPYDVDSAGFINYIRNAEYVCTDSFHASVFSILYKRKFFTFRRFKASYSLQTNNRIDTLLDSLSLRDRLLMNDADPSEYKDKEIDYDSVESKIEALREINMKFLKNAVDSL